MFSRQEREYNISRKSISNANWIGSMQGDDFLFNNLKKLAQYRQKFSYPLGYSPSKTIKKKPMHPPQPNKNLETQFRKFIKKAKRRSLSPKRKKTPKRKRSKSNSRLENGHSYTKNYDSNHFQSPERKEYLGSISNHYRNMDYNRTRDLRRKVQEKLEVGPLVYWILIPILGVL